MDDIVELWGFWQAYDYLKDKLPPPAKDNSHPLGEQFIADHPEIFSASGQLEAFSLIHRGTFHDAAADAEQVKRWLELHLAAGPVIANGRQFESTVDEDMPILFWRRGGALLIEDEGECSAHPTILRRDGSRGFNPSTFEREGWSAVRFYPETIIAAANASQSVGTTESIDIKAEPGTPSTPTSKPLSQVYGNPSGRAIINKAIAIIDAACDEQGVKRPNINELPTGVHEYMKSCSLLAHKTLIKKIGIGAGKRGDNGKRLYGRRLPFAALALPAPQKLD